MEEKKKNLQVTKNTSSPVQKKEMKYTEEQLNEACRQIYDSMARKLQQMNMSNMFKRLDYLFKVLEFRDCFDDDFIDTCANEVKEILTIPKENMEEVREEKKE